MREGVHEFVKRLGSLFRRRRMEREMAEELEFHQAMLRSKYLREGMPTAVAEKAARKTFGDARRWQERLREVWQFRWLENLVRDIRSRSNRTSAGDIGYRYVIRALTDAGRSDVLSPVDDGGPCS